jgi:hypothetical protein
MYREDLDEFVGMFQRACATVTISDNRNRYLSLDEMKTHAGHRIKDLDVRGEKPGLHFLLNQKERVDGSSAPIVFNELRTEEISDEADALFFKIREFLVARQQPRVRWHFMIVAIIMLATILFMVFRHFNDSQAPLSLLIYAIVFAGFTIAALKTENYLSLETRLNSPSFWARHRDAFAAHAVTASISALLGGIAGWLACHYLK